MRDGKLKDLNEEVQVILYQNGIELCVIYVRDINEGEDIIQRWREGTYQILNEGLQ